ncbi:hypothetical protein TNCV_4984341 [Trichonephila clavipes]|nr:hypothetical protein TNCV_4984341 [Trichonephila clavipes]
MAGVDVTASETDQKAVMKFLALEACDVDCIFRHARTPITSLRSRTRPSGLKEKIQTLDTLHKAIKNKHPGMLPSDIVISQDNRRSHVAKVCRGTGQ